MLSCNCDPDGCDQWYEHPQGFKKLIHYRRKRCKSCKRLVEVGSDIVEFRLYRAPDDDIEEMELGCEILIDKQILCETCGGMALNLIELGYSVDIWSDNVFDLLKEYQEMTGWKNEY